MEDTKQGVSFNRILAIALAVVAIAMVIYQLISPFRIFVGPNQHQLIHLSFTLVLLSLIFMRQAKRQRLAIPLGFIYIVMTLFSLVYTFPRVPWLEFMAGQPDLPFIVVVIGMILTFLVWEISRQALGLAIPVVALLFLLYAYFGQYISTGFFQGPPVDINRLFIRLGIGNLGANGIFGPILGMSANVVFLFFVYGALLETTGGIRPFIEIGKWAGRKLAGGPAITAVVTSALVGTITGSPTANIVISGSFNIPAMKRAGYKPYQAAAIEATASTGGVLMPPVMGLVAFMMVAMTGIPYIIVCKMAAIPAVLYYLSAGFYAQFHGLKMRILGTFKRPTEERIDFKEIQLGAPLLVIPLLFLIVILVKGFSLGYAIALTIFLLFLLSLVRKETRRSPKQLLDGLTKGAIAGAGVAVICACIGLILGAMSFTVLIPKIPMIVTSISGGHLLPTLILTATSSIILGMGVSVIVAYLIPVLVVGPSLLAMGLTLAQVHLFTLYFAVIGFVTPPVAVSSLVAAKMAGAPFMQTAFEATKVAVAGFIVPMLFVYCPILMLEPSGMSPLLSGLLMIEAFLLLLTLQAVICGQYFTMLNWRERGLFSLIALALFLPFPLRSSGIAVIGLAAFTLGTTWQWIKRSRMKRVISPETT